MTLTLGFYLVEKRYWTRGNWFYVGKSGQILYDVDDNISMKDYWVSVRILWFLINIGRQEVV